MNINPLNMQRFFLMPYFMASGDPLQLVPHSTLQGNEPQLTVPRGLELSLSLLEVEKLLKDGPILVDLRDASALPPPLTQFPRQLGCKAAAYVPILQTGQLRGLVLIGAREEHELSEEVVDRKSVV